MEPTTPTDPHEAATVLAGPRPLPGGASGETFLAPGPDGEDVVLRIYGGRSLTRGPAAPEVDAALLDLVGELVPVPRVLEARPGDPGQDLPGVLVTELVPGVALASVLDRLDEEELLRVGAALGALAARLGHVVHPREGTFADRSLSLVPFPPHLRDLEAYAEHHAPRLAHVLGERGLETLRGRAAEAQDLLLTSRRRCLVHGDLGPENVLVDPDTLEVTAVVDWEFAHVGSAWTDLGHLLRGHGAEETWTHAVLTAYAAWAPRPARGRGGPTDHGELRELARAADLFSLVDLAVREGEDPAVVRARELLGDPDHPGGR